MMQGHLRFGRSVVVMMIVGMGLMMAGTRSVAQADIARSKVIPRDANVYGNSYGEWSAGW